MWPFKDTDQAFRDAVRENFGPLAQQFGAKLIQIEPMMFGFSTDYAVLTIGAYPGHFRGICVTLRRREQGERVSVKAGADIGLANVEEFVTGQRSAVYTKRQRWTAGEIQEEVAGLASISRRVAMSFLATAAGDWVGLRAFVDQKIANAPKPWLGLNLQEPVQRTQRNAEHGLSPHASSGSENPSSRDPRD
jgi:hypothetical protein